MPPPWADAAPAPAALPVATAMAMPEAEAAPDPEAEPAPATGTVVPAAEAEPPPVAEPLEAAMVTPVAAAVLVPAAVPTVSLVALVSSSANITLALSPLGVVGALVAEVPVRIRYSPNNAHVGGSTAARGGVVDEGGEVGGRGEGADVALERRGPNEQIFLAGQARHRHRSGHGAINRRGLQRASQLEIGP
jgi:hypothetical protein